MKPELKAKWVAALRSGKYEQVQGQLRYTKDGKHSYCCLGVLCDVSGEGTWDRTSYDIDTEDIEGITSLDGQLDGLGQRMFGITAPQEETLIAMNDEHKASFAEIADYIEANL